MMFSARINEVDPSYGRILEEAMRVRQEGLNSEMRQYYEKYGYGGAVFETADGTVEKFHYLSCEAPQEAHRIWNNDTKEHLFKALIFAHYFFGQEKEGKIVRLFIYGSKPCANCLKSFAKYSIFEIYGQVIFSGVKERLLFYTLEDL